MYEVIRLLKRAHDMSVEQFQIQLRERYAPVMVRLPDLKRFVLSPALPQGYARGELIFDCLAEMWFDSADCYPAAQASPYWLECMPVERDMVDCGRAAVMPVDVYVTKETPFGPNSVKNIEFVNRRSGMDLEHFRRYWRAVHGPLAARIELSGATSRTICA